MGRSITICLHVLSSCTLFSARLFFGFLFPLICACAIPVYSFTIPVCSFT